MNVDAVATGVGLDDVEQLGPGLQRWIAQAGDRVGLVECHGAARANEPERFGDDLVRLRDVYQYQPGSHHVESFGRQAATTAISLDHLDIAQAPVVHIAAGSGDSIAVRFEADDRAGRPHAPSQQMRQPRGPQPISTTRAPGVMPI